MIDVSAVVTQTEIVTQSNILAQWHPLDVRVLPITQNPQRRSRLPQASPSCLLRCLRRFHSNIHLSPTRAVKAAVCVAPLMSLLTFSSQLRCPPWNLPRASLARLKTYASYQRFHSFRNHHHKRARSNVLQTHPPTQAATLVWHQAATSASIPLPNYKSIVANPTAPHPTPPPRLQHPPLLPQLTTTKPLRTMSHAIMRQGHTAARR